MILPTLLFFLGGLVAGEAFIFAGFLFPAENLPVAMVTISFVKYVFFGLFYHISE